VLLPQLRESRLDPREDRGLSELGKDPLCLGQMLDSEGALSLTLVKKAKDERSRELNSVGTELGSKMGLS